MELEKYLELLIKQCQHKISSEEEILLTQWLEQSSENLAIKDHLEKVWNVTQHYQQSYTPNVAAGLERFQQTIAENATSDVDHLPEVLIDHLQGKSPLPKGEKVPQDIEKIWQVTKQYQRSYTPDVAAGLLRFQQTLAELETHSTDQSFSELIIKRLSNHISDAENARLDQWLAESPENYQLFEELAQVWDSTEKYQESYEPDVAAGLARFQQSLTDELPASPSPKSETPVKPIGKRPRRSFNTLGIAAAVALLLVAGYLVLFNGSSMVEVKTANTSKVVTLPDGSKVTLNKNSVLTYNKKFENRVVKFKGEAFFEVTKQNGQSFSILSNDVKTEVLGTSFNVKASDKTKGVEVTVVTGKVAVSLEKETTKKVVLVPGDKAIYEQKQAEITKEKNTNKNFLAWKTHRLTYDNNYLREVLPELERYYQVKIEAQNKTLLNCLFTGNFNNITLKEVLNIIEYSLDASYEKLGDKYIIKGKGCE